MTLKDIIAGKTVLPFRNDFQELVKDMKKVKGEISRVGGGVHRFLPHSDSIHTIIDSYMYTRVPVLGYNCACNSFTLHTWHAHTLHSPFFTVST